jgi:hypothetical protein
LPRYRLVGRRAFAALFLTGLAVCGFLLGLNGAGMTRAAASGPCGTKTGAASIQHVVWIFMENHNYSDIAGNTSEAPYENQLAGQCGLATSYQGITHPSLPNYIAATSGSDQGISDDNPPADHPLSVPSIYTQLKAAGLQWRDYEESAPGNCPSDSSGDYAVKHDPAPYYTNIAADCANWDVPLGSPSSGNLVNDINAGSLPAFSFITPNLCNDMHDCSIATGDAWLQQMVPKILAGPNYQAGNTAVVITFDEDEGQGIVFTTVVSPYTPAGSTSGTAFSHYSLLKTTEQLLGLGQLGNAASANSMLSAFFSNSTPATTSTSTTSTTSTTSSTTRTTSTTTTTPNSTTTTTTPSTTSTTTPSTTSTTTPTRTTTTPSTTTSTTTPTTTPSTTTATTPITGSGPLPYRYVYNFGNTSTDFQAQALAGWNLLDVSSVSAADALPAGTRGLVWLGDYNDANGVCAFDQSDSTITSEVQNGAGDPKVAGYLLSDEPDATLCPNAPQQHADRTALIHRIDPSKFTVVALDGHDEDIHGIGQFPQWAGATDFQAIDPYPCYVGQTTCDYGQIDRAVAAADAAGLRYWGIIQAFSDPTWRMPTALEEQTIIDHWCASHWQGAATFAWDYGTAIPNNVLAVLNSLNVVGCPSTSAGGGTTTSTTTPTTTSTSTSTTTTTTPGTTTGPDTTPPTAPMNLRVSNGTKDVLTLVWDPSFDDTGVAEYRVFRDGIEVSRLSADSLLIYLDNSVKCQDAYEYTVEAVDLAGNVSPPATYLATCGFH